MWGHLECAIEFDKFIARDRESVLLNENHKHILPDERTHWKIRIPRRH